RLSEKSFQFPKTTATNRGSSPHTAGAIPLALLVSGERYSRRHTGDTDPHPRPSAQHHGSKSAPPARGVRTRQINDADVFLRSTPRVDGAQKRTRTSTTCGTRT